MEKKKFCLALVTVVTLLCSAIFIGPERVMASDRQIIKAVGIPSADHYPGVVAFEKYRDEMKYADYQLELLPGPKLVRAYFRSGPESDIAFNVCPMVMDMFAQKPDFRWVSLIHRDGNALAVNEMLNKVVKVEKYRKMRKPDSRVADAFAAIKKDTGRPVECAIPSPLSTHTTVLYKYLRDHNASLGFGREKNIDVVLKVVKPPKSPAYLKKKSSRGVAAAFEQSLPWAELVETGGFGHVAWYSKDVMDHPKGHVECIIIAKDEAIQNKREALREVIYFIHKAGQDIEIAKKNGGSQLEEIVTMIRKHIPKHSAQAITQSLRADLNVINYSNLNVDSNSKTSFKHIMELAFEAGFISEKIDIEALADESFATNITVQ